MFIKLWRLLAPFHRVFYKFIGLIIIYELLQMGASYIPSLLIIFVGRQTGLTTYLLLFFGIFLYQEIYMWLDNYVDWHIVAKHSYPIYHYLKTKTAEKFMQLDLGWHQQQNSGALVGKVINGIDKVEELVSNMSWEFFPTLIQTLVSLMPLAIISWYTLPIVFVALGLFMWLTYVYYKESLPLRKARHDLYEDEWHKSVEMVQSVDKAQLFNQDKRLLAEHSALVGDISDKGLLEARKAIFFANRWRIRVLNISVILIMLIWVAQMEIGILSIATFVYAYTLLQRLTHAFWRFARLMERSFEASEGVLRLNALHDELPTIISGAVPVEQLSDLDIKFENVKFTYPDEGGSVDDLIFQVKQGQKVALVGPSGAGKTTIRKLIERFFDISHGSISIGGTDIRDLCLDGLRSLISYVPQGDDVHISSTSVYENIAYTNVKATPEEVENAARLAGIHEFIMGLPEGYKTQVGERGQKLSGGQKQRIALASAILADRPILFLDEPTSALDSITEREIQNSMQEILEGKTVIIVAHRLSTVWNLVDQIIVMEDGQILDIGTHNELMNSCSLYQQMVQLQSN